MALFTNRVILIIAAFLILPGCSESKIPPGFIVLNPDLCLPTSSVMAKVDDRPGRRVLEGVVNFQRNALEGRCANFEAVEITHFEGHSVWRVIASRANGWKLTDWQQDKSFDSFELVVLSEYNKFLRATEQKNSADAAGESDPR